MLIVMADSYLAHPLKGLGYQFFSGIGSSISEWAATLTTIGTFITLWWKQHACHVHKCETAIGEVCLSAWRGTYIPVCKPHHPEHPKGGGQIVHHSGKIMVGK